MTRDEMRAIRRQGINEWIHHNYHRYLKGWELVPLQVAKRVLRESEVEEFGYELKAYAGDWQS